RSSVVETFSAARTRIFEGDHDMVVFDEINNVLHRGDLPLQEMTSLIEERPAGTELVLTGRNAPPEILERADLVTRMEAEKHPATRGISARRGIEY
ncbi:MAG: cob(I)yrinic acid a,c-diamide adenosyltransferase, partial [Desulfuromonadales bacterium]